MNQVVVKIGLSVDVNVQGEIKIDVFKNIYDVDSIGKRVNCTLRSHLDNIKKDLIPKILIESA